MGATPTPVLAALHREPVEVCGVRIHPMSVAHEIAFERAGCSFGGSAEWSTERVVKAVYLARFPASEVLSAQRKMKDSDIEDFAAGLSSADGLTIVKTLLEVVTNADKMSAPGGGENPTQGTAGSLPSLPGSAPTMDGA